MEGEYTILAAREITNLDDGLRRLFQDHLPRVHWQPIESWMTGAGIPDLNGCSDAAEFWVECKATRAYAVKMKAEQVGWALHRRRVGGRAFIAVRRRISKKKIDELYLHDGLFAREVKAVGIRAPRLGSWQGGPGRWAWVEVLALLRA